MKIYHINKYQNYKKRHITDYFTTYGTHRSISWYTTCEAIFHPIPVNIRRCSNIFVIFKSIDMNNLRNICDILNLDNKILTMVFEDICQINMII